MRLRSFAAQRAVALPRRPEGERGATAVLTIILLVPVLFGAAAISVDVGNLLWERRQLQNGADAAAMVAARTCVNAGACPAPSTLSALAGRNANDGVTDVVQICGNPAMTLPAGVTTPCSTTYGVADCAAPTATQALYPYIEVRTRTKTVSSTSPNAMSNLFARIIGGPASTSVAACSRAAWGPPSGGASGAPITVSGCDWQHATGGTPGGGGGAYYPMPNYSGSNPNGYGGSGQPAWPAPAVAPPAQNPGGEVILLVQNPPGGQIPPNSCSSWQGHALPGGFGILESTSDPCVLKTYPFDWMHTDTGNSTACNLANYVGTVISLPVFDCTNNSLPSVAGIPPAGSDCTTGNGTNAWFHRQGYAYFYLSGYHLTTSGSVANTVKSLVSNTAPCNGGASCISGWFVSGELKNAPLGPPPGGPGDFGSYTFSYLG